MQRLIKALFHCRYLQSSTPERIMRRHEQSVAALALASTVLPSAEVIQLPTSKRHTLVAGAFTKTGINRMRCPPGKSEAFFWDATCSGFGLRALKSGRRSWIYQYRDDHKRTRRIALGDVSAVSLNTARAAARRHAASSKVPIRQCDARRSAQP